jgi:DMSO/TMAO reductase YedYZ molybdopterin-dependent catalytic subunit
MECAGNGRAHVEPHVVSQPWLVEAVGTARWRGVTVAGVLADAGVQDDAVEVLFTGLDRGVDGGERRRTSGPWRSPSCSRVTRSSRTR